MGNMTETEFRKHVFGKMKLAPSQVELAEAIYYGRYCKTATLVDIKQATDELVNVMMVYFGMEDKKSTVLETMRELLPAELKKYYPHLTIEEITIAINKGIRNDFGDYDAFRPSLKLFRDLINRYENSDMRRGIRKEFSEAKAQFQPSDFISEERQEEIIINGVIESFKKYSDKREDFYIQSRNYDTLMDYCALPDFKEHLPLASSLVKAKKKEFNPKDRDMKPIELSDALKRLFIITATVEAKKMALKKFYDQLLEAGKTIEDYITVETVSDEG